MSLYIVHLYEVAKSHQLLAYAAICCNLSGAETKGKPSQSPEAPPNSSPPPRPFSHLRFV